MDLKIPAMDSLEATRRIRALATPLNSIPIWVVSACVFLTDNEAALTAGADGFLGKPLYIPKLASVLQWAAAGHPAQSCRAGSRSLPATAQDEWKAP